jgi:drug/metabolite transporter (DMT)-like permease
VLVRAKIFQLLGIASGVVLLSTALHGGQQADVQWGPAAAVLAGCAVTSYCLWFYSSRYVGELSLLQPDQ